MKRLLHNEFTALLLKIATLYLVLFCTQVIFYGYNRALLGSISTVDFWPLLKGSLLFDNASISYLNFAFIILSLLPFRFRCHPRYKKALFWLYTLTNSLGIVALNITDVIYYRYTFKRVTWEERHFFSHNENTFGLIFQFIGENWLIILLAIGLIAGMVWIYRVIDRRIVPQPIRGNAAYYTIHTLLLGLACVLMVFGIRGSFDMKARPVTLSNAAMYTHSPEQASLILSNPFCLFRTIGMKDFEVLQYFDDAQAERLFSPYHYPDGAGRYDLGKKNIVIFVLESFSKEHSQFLMPEENRAGGYTPFLDSLMRDGYVFTNAFANGMKSIEALPSILTSIPSYQTAFPLLPQSIGAMDGLPAIMGRRGYSTHFFCGAHANQMGFEAFCRMAGIQHLHSREDFEQRHREKDMANCWGIWDMPFLRFTAETLDQLDTPFFATVFTLTSHHPYDLPEPYDKQMPQGTTMVHPCVAYTDLSIRRFFETASKQAWFQNTLFVFVADHVSPKIAHPVTRTAKGRSAIVCFLYTPDHSLRGVSNETVQQLDLMPTILGLVGNREPYFAFGRDVFNERERMPIATNCVNQIYQCITDSISIYFNGKACIQAFDARDSLQECDILNPGESRQQRAEERLKAILQSYTRHVSGKSYLVPQP